MRKGVNNLYKKISFLVFKLSPLLVFIGAFVHKELVIRMNGGISEWTDEADLGFLYSLIYPQYFVLMLLMFAFKRIPIFAWSVGILFSGGGIYFAFSWWPDPFAHFAIALHQWFFILASSIFFLIWNKKPPPQLEFVPPDEKKDPLKMRESLEIL